MRRVRRFQGPLVRWLNLCVCLTVVLCSLAIAPLRLESVNTYARAPRIARGQGVQLTSASPITVPPPATLAKIVLAIESAAACHDGAGQGRQPASSIEAEDLVGSAKASAGNVVRQDMRGFGPGWGNNAQLFWGAPAPADKPIRNWPHLTLYFKVPVAATYEILLHYTTAPDYATFRVFLDGQPAFDIEGYAPKVAPKARSLGKHQLSAGSHQLVITVFSKAPASKGFSVGLDRIEWRAPQGGAGTNVIPNTDNVRPQRPIRPMERRPPQTEQPDIQPPQGNKPSGASNVKPIKPDVLTREVCAASPETCCPAGSTSTDGCKLIAEGLLEIRIRSYVPPRFTTMGRFYPWDTDNNVENIVSDVSISGPYKVWPGCRFNVTVANNKIDYSKNVLQKAGELLEAWLSQWSGGVESAKTFVSQGVANEVCKAVNDSQSCRDKVAAVVKIGINLGLASLGIPPNIPDIHELREQGIRYIAAEAASSALGDPEILKDLPLDDKTRELLYQKAYDKAVDVLAKELNKALPSPNFSKDNPATWGHIEPAYAPHNAHLYVEVRVKPEGYAKYLHFLAAKPTHKWAPVYLHDLNHVWESIGPMEIPTFIPPDGLILPIELKPYEVAYTSADTAAAQIPGVKISRTWLEQKFGLSAGDGLVRGQLNYRFGSDWDLFYDPVKYVTKIRKSSFRLLMVVGSKGVLDWAKDWSATVATVRDADVGYTAVTPAGKLQNYFGRIDPAPLCDGRPNVVYVK